MGGGGGVGCTSETLRDGGGRVDTLTMSSQVMSMMSMMLRSI
jgi:hypothetical protein